MYCPPYGFGYGCVSSCETDGRLGQASRGDQGSRGRDGQGTPTFNVDFPILKKYHEVVVCLR